MLPVHTPPCTQSPDHRRTDAESSEVALLDETGKQKKLNELPSVRTVFHIHAVHFLYTTVSFQVFGKTIEETGLICYTNRIPSWHWQGILGEVPWQKKP